MVADYRERISGLLQAEIVSTFKKHYGDSKTWDDRWRIEAKDLEVRFPIEATDKGSDVEVRFRLQVKLNDNSDRETSLYVDPILVFLANEGAENASASDIVNPERVPVHKTVAVAVPPVPHWDREKNYDLANVLFPTKNDWTAQGVLDDRVVSLPKVTMPIPKSLNNQIRNNTPLRLMELDSELPFAKTELRVDIMTNHCNRR
jgi:hypothetical protein